MLQQSGGVGSIPGRTPPLERHDKGSRACSISSIPALGAKNATSPSTLPMENKPVRKSVGFHFLFHKILAE